MRVRFALFLLGLFSCNAQADESLQDCYDQAMSQEEINLCAEVDYQKARRELQQLVHRIQLAYREDPDFLQRLKASQQAWQAYHEAQLTLRYPHIGDPAMQGGNFPTCLNNYRVELVRTRIQALRPWLDGMVEGDLCCGSIRFTPQINLKVDPGHEQ